MKRNYLFVFLWAGPVILFAPALFLGRLLFFGTISMQFVPWRWAAWQALLAGELPLWNAYSGLGSPLIANYQSALFYPLNWLLAVPTGIAGVVGLAWGQGALVVLHLLLAGFGMARLAKALGLGRLSQVVAGLAFGMSGYLVARSHFLSMNTAAAWLPWIMLYIFKLLHAKQDVRKPQVVGLTISLAMLLLAGHAQIAWYTCLLAAAWAIFWLYDSRKDDAYSHKELSDGLVETKRALTAVPWLALAGGMALLIAGIQLLPTAELLQTSQRAAGADESFVMTYSFWPWRLIGFISPSFFGNPAFGNYWGYANFWEDAVYIGILPFFLALRAVFQREKGRVRALIYFLLGVTLVSMTLALGQNTPVFPFLYNNVPTFDLFQAPTRFSIWAIFALALLAGIGTQGWSANISTYSRRQSGRWTAVGVAFVLAGLGAIFFLPEIEMSFGVSILMTGLFGAAAAALGISRSRGAGWRFVVLLLILMDLVIAGWNLNPGIEADFYAGPASNAANLTESLDGGRLYLFADDAYALTFDNYYSFETFEADRAGLRSSMLPNLYLLDNIRSANQFDPLIPERYDRYFETLEGSSEELSSWLLSQANVTLTERFLSVGEENRLRFSKRHAQPRVEWFSCAENVSSEEEAFEALLAMAENREWGLVIEAPESVSCESEASGEAFIIEEAGNQLVIQTSADEAGWLLLRDTYYPGWQVEIDGEDVEIYAGNYLFRAVRVPSGTHQLDFHYRPGAFRAGVFLSAVGLAGLAGLVYFARKESV